MFNTKTLFILGAGASCPYGFPSGKELISKILDNMEDFIFIPCYTQKNGEKFDSTDITNKIFYDFILCEEILLELTNLFDRLLVEHFTLRPREATATYDIDFEGIDNSNKRKISYFQTRILSIDAFNNLKIALKEFDPVSIDAFLRDNPKYALAGKVMIIYSLLKDEHLASFNVGSSDNWFSLFLNDLISECAGEPSKLLQNNLRITTFNYDISLDYYLESRLSNIEVFNKNEGGLTLAEKYLQGLKINHIYGQIKSPSDTYTYGEHSDESNRMRTTQTQPNSLFVGNFKRFIYSIINYNNIKTIYDERSDATFINQVIERNKEDINWAKDIIIIGFGFDRDNLDLLGFPDDLHELCKFFEGKTIRFLNYKGQMNSVSGEFKKILEESANIFARKRRGNPHKPEFKLIESRADKISSAYLNDFKKYLFK